MTLSGAVCFQKEGGGGFTGTGPVSLSVWFSSSCSVTHSGRGSGSGSASETVVTVWFCLLVCRFLERPRSGPGLPVSGVQGVCGRGFPLPERRGGPGLWRPSAFSPPLSPHILLHPFSAPPPSAAASPFASPLPRPSLGCCCRRGVPASAGCRGNVRTERASCSCRRCGRRSSPEAG